ncbi:MAG: lytic murein transglycosylase [Hyphomicrobiaceae bacterium]
MAASTRRSVSLLGAGLGAGMIAAIAGAWIVLTLWPTPPSMPPTLSPVAATPTAPQLSPQQFASFIEFLRVDAATQGIAPATFDAAFAGMAADGQVLELASTQPEYVKTAGEYLTLLVSEARLETGRQKLQEVGATLAAVEATYGVDRHVVLAIWGIESNFGAGMGVRSVLRSLATLAASDSRRPEFWRNELLAALRMLQSGEAKSVDLAGSWAGAMGHTQFMPTTYIKHAVDFDRDGRRDIWGSVADALGSTGNYLKAWGWSSSSPWGFEVRLPDGFDYGLSNPGVMNTWGQWQALGVAIARPGSVAPSGTLAALQLLLPAGAKGPAFVVGDNFRAILKYNNSIAYALAVGHLADQLAGGSPLVTPWPPGDRSLAKAERDEVQRRLTSLGFDTGGVDGVIGNGTKAAIRLFQKTRGLPQDGHADVALIDRLRQEGG